MSASEPSPSAPMISGRSGARSRAHLDRDAALLSDVGLPARAGEIHHLRAREFKLTGCSIDCGLARTIIEISRMRAMVRATSSTAR